MRRYSPPSTLPLAGSNKDKRYGWYRKYEDFVGHPKWRIVAKRAGVHLAFVHCVIDALFQSASKARAKGGIGSFDFDTCEAATDIPAEQIAQVYRTLTQMGWINNGYIVHWEDRQPRDATAGDRQRNKRARDEAKRAFVAGHPTSEQVDMLTATERAALERLSANLSHVTQPAMEPKEVISRFVLPCPDDDSIEAQQVNVRAARKWLIGEGRARPGYGIASKIIADNFGCERPTADTTIRCWISNEMAGDAATLAQLISCAQQQGLEGDAFRNVVEGGITAYVRQCTAGPALPLGITRGVISGGRS